MKSFILLCALVMLAALGIGFALGRWTADSGPRAYLSNGTISGYIVIDGKIYSAAGSNLKLVKIDSADGQK